MKYLNAGMMECWKDGMPESKGLKKRGKLARLAGLQKSFTMNVSSGFTLLELLISIAILSIIMIGLHQVMGTALSAHRRTTEKTELLAQARYAMERMVMFVQETDQIEVPSADKLVVSERLLDTYDNESHNYVLDGDGYLDADNDHNGLVNEGTLEDPPDPLTYDLDKTDGNAARSRLPEADRFPSRRILPRIRGRAAAWSVLAPNPPSPSHGPPRTGQVWRSDRQC